MQDAKSGAPLFNSNAWKTAKNILNLIQQGFVSDPPDVPLYFQLGLDGSAGNLPIYRCIRGTNNTEGGVHKHLRRHLPQSGVSIRHISAALTDFTLHHNLTVGTYNSTGKPYRGHFDISLTNRLQEMIILTENLIPENQRITGWVNGNLYAHTSEVIGILPIPEDIRTSSEMLAFDASLPNMHTSQHFLALRQGTLKAVMPIHTPHEHKLFRELMSTHNAFRSQDGPYSKEAVRVWNHHANSEDDVYYKVS